MAGARNFYASTLSIFSRTRMCEPQKLSVRFADPETTLAYNGNTCSIRKRAYKFEISKELDYDFDTFDGNYVCWVH